MKDKKLSDAIFKIATAFVLLYVDLNFGNLNAAPNWVGYGIILKTFDTLAEEEPTVKLLETPGYILAGWSFVEWVARFFGYPLNGYGIAWIMSVLQLYFQFQLLTNLAGIAEAYAPGHEGRILQLRSLMTVVLTGYTLYSVFEPPQAVTLAVAIVYLGAAALTVKVLMGLQKDIAPPEEAETPFSAQLRENAEAYDRGK